jgi:TPR repeat protein
MQGKGWAKNPVRARDLFKRAADANCREGMHHYAAMVQNEELNMGEAKHYYELAALNGVEEASINLAGIMAKEEGVPQNVKGTILALEQCTAKGFLMAVYNLSVIYASPDFGVHDFAKAKPFYESAAELKCSEGMLTFGQILLREINAMAAKSVPANEIEKIRARVVEFIRTAADAKLLDAQTQYKKLLVEGNLVTVNCAVGVDYLDVAASRGSLYAMLLLGKVLYDGRGGLPRDPVRAKALWTKAALRPGTNRMDQIANAEAKKRLATYP